MSAVLAGQASGASAAAGSRAAAGPGAGYAVARTAAVSQVKAAAVTPAATPSDAWCRGKGSNYFGWFGIAPGSSADGGVASDLWWDAKGDASPAQMQIYTGNGGANQQWCEVYIGGGQFIFYSDYIAGLPQCLTLKNGYEDGYPLGMRVTAADCASVSAPINEDQLWFACSRSGNSISIEPGGVNWGSSTWLDVWGGSSNNGKSAFVAMNPLQIWSGNGQDNQRFTLVPSPGEAAGIPYAFDNAGTVPGC